MQPAADFPIVFIKRARARATFHTFTALVAAEVLRFLSTLRLRREKTNKDSFDIASSQNYCGLSCSLNTWGPWVGTQRGSFQTTADFPSLLP